MTDEVTTPEELDALPEGAVIRDAWEGIAEKGRDGWNMECGHGLTGLPKWFDGVRDDIVRTLNAIEGLGVEEETT